MIIPNIIVTKNFNTMEKIFFGAKNLGDAKPTTLSQVLEDLKDEDALICAPGKNDTLVEADLNIPVGPSPKGYLNLKFVETRKVIEYFLLDTSPLETNFNILYSLVTKAKIGADETLKKLNRYYISFGTGDDLNEWAGPFECSLGSAELELNNNVKVITLGMLLGELGSIRKYTRKLHKIFGFGVDADKLNPPFAKDTKVTTAASIPLNKGLDVTRGPLDIIRNITRKRCLLPTRGWNAYTRELLREYLGQIFGDSSRVLILLKDDLDVIFNNDLKGVNSVDFYRNYQGKLREFGIQLLIRSPQSNPEVGPGTKFGRVKQPKPGTASVNGENVEIDARFNIDNDELNDIKTQRGDGTRAGLENKTKFQKRRLNRIYNDFAERQGNSEAIREKMTQYIDLWDDEFLITKMFMDMKSTIEVTPSLKTPKDTLDPIYEFIGALRKYQGNTTEYGIFEIADSEINKLIKESNPAEDGEPIKNYVVFGDVSLIKKLIYMEDDGKTPITQRDYGLTFADGLLDSIDWEGYQEKYRATVLAREKRLTSSFKEQLDFGPFTADFKELSEVKDIIFLHGVKNSNVQRVNFRKDLAQGELLKINFEARKKSPELNVFIKSLLLNDDFKIDQIVDYLRLKDVFGDSAIESKLKLVNFLTELQKDEAEFAKFKKLQDKTNSRILSEGLESSNEDFEEFIDLIIGYKEVLDKLSVDGFTADVPYLSDIKADENTVLRRQVDLLEKVRKLIHEVQVKTVPFFNQKMYFNRRAYFFSQYNNIITSDHTGEFRIPSTLLNGSYKIIGARHFLSSEDAFSEFTIVKDGTQEDPILEITKDILSEQSSSFNKKKSKDKPKASEDFASFNDVVGLDTVGLQTANIPGRLDATANPTQAGEAANRLRRKKIAENIPKPFQARIRSPNRD